MTIKKILFIVLFTSIGLAAMQIKVSNLVGSNANFTLFDSFAPITGAFLGTAGGVLSVLIMQIVNFFLHSSFNTDIGSVIRLIPMMAAVVYFPKKTDLNIVIPILAIIAFVIHPVGRQVWFFSLFWTIPIMAHFYRDKNLLIRSLGATFAAHSVGGAMWIYASDFPVSVWISLIPIVAIERGLFAVGIALSYLITNKVLNYLITKDLAPRHIYEVHKSQN